jgi:hypothetical protein
LDLAERRTRDNGEGERDQAIGPLRVRRRRDVSHNSAPREQALRDQHSARDGHEDQDDATAGEEAHDF